VTEVPDHQRRAVDEAETARRVETISELLRVGWDRSWTFTPLLQHGRPRRKTDRRWTWQWAVVGWLAVCLVPAVLMDVYTHTSRTWIIYGASVKVTPIDDDPDRDRRARAASTVWAASFVALLAFILPATSLARMAGGRHG
jgi:hypothetical protein